MDCNGKTSKLVSLYRLWAAVPTIKWGRIVKAQNGVISVQSCWSGYHPAQEEKTTYRKAFFSRGEGVDFSFSAAGFPTDSSNEKLHSISPSQQQTGILRKLTDKKGEKQQYLEIWNSNSLWKSWDLNALNVHGDVNDDAQFGCLRWSPDESKLVYVAEKKQPKSLSFFSQKPSQDSDTSQEQGIGQYREEWGEQLLGRHHPVACVVDITTSEITEIDLGSKSCGQVIWGPQGDSLICVGWNEEPKRLGLIFCTNRKSALYKIDVKNGNKVSLLYDQEGWSHLYPRLSPDAKTLVFLQVPDKGPHRACAKLCKMDLATKAVSVIVDVVEKAYGDKFPGLYCDNLIGSCFSTDGQHVFLTSPWRSKMVIVCVHLKTGEISRITNDAAIGSHRLLDIFDNYALAVASAPNLKPHLVFSDLRGFLTSRASPVWLPVEDTDNSIPDINWKILDFQPKGCDDKASMFQAILVTPNLDPPQKCPLVVIPHGGPHSVIDAGFGVFTTLFLKLNFAVLAVNYRGSLGFGDNVLRSLLGSVGTADVSDVQQSVESLKSEPWMDSSQIVLFGGSHGGFLSTHLIGQYPETYRACICRNPVVDISGKYETTDIPDWGFAESGQQEKFDFSVLPSPDIRNRMWECSPYQYINKVKTPLLLLIGRVDLRVPPSQGINYYNTLKAMGKTCQMYVYDDNHSLSISKVESDTFVRTGLWIFQHLGI